MFKRAPRPRVIPSISLPEPSHHQRLRAWAMAQAREAIEARGGFAVAPAPDVVDLVTVARWIVDGQHPWPPSAPDEVLKTSSGLFDGATSRGSVERPFA